MSRNREPERRVIALVGDAGAIEQQLAPWARVIPVQGEP